MFLHSLYTLFLSKVFCFVKLPVSSFLAPWVLWQKTKTEKCVVGFFPPVCFSSFESFLFSPFFPPPVSSIRGSLSPPLVGNLPPSAAYPSTPFVGDRFHQSPLLPSAHKSLLLTSTLQYSLLTSTLKRALLPSAHQSMLLQSPLLASTPLFPLRQSAFLCPLCQSAQKSLCSQSTHRGLRFPGAPQTAISPRKFWGGGLPAMAHGVPWSAMAARVPGSNMAHGVSWSAMAPWIPGSALDAHAPRSNVGPGTGAALEATFPVSISLEASRAATPPPHWILHGAGHACWGGDWEMSDLCPHVLCLPSSCVHIWSFLFPVHY